jgi:hypothetical protein
MDRFSNTLQPEPVWLTAGKQPGKNYRPGQSCRLAGIAPVPLQQKNR